VSEPVVLPPDAGEFLREPNHAVVGWVGESGRPYTVATWYAWDDGRVFMNLDARRKRLSRFTVGAPVSLTILDAENWYRHLSLYGDVARVEPDVDLSGIDQLAVRYTGSPYRDRDNDRVNVWAAVRAWHGWIAGVPWRRRT
jgi:hypothetical protein